MKKILATLVVGALACGVFAQTQTQTKAAEMELIKAKLQEQVCTELQNLDEAVKEQVQAAKQAALEVQAQIKAMKMSGKSDADVEAKMSLIRTEAQTKLNAAIQNMEQIQAQVEKASEDIQNRLQSKQGEAAAVKAKSGTGAGQGGKPVE